MTIAAIKFEGAQLLVDAVNNLSLERFCRIPVEEILAQTGAEAEDELYVDLRPMKWADTRQAAHDERVRDETDCRC